MEKIDELRTSKDLRYIYLNPALQLNRVRAQKLAEALQENDSLVELKLVGNQLGAEGAEIVASGIEERHSLKSVCIAANEIGEVGGEALARVLNSTTISSLRLGDNALAGGGAAALSQALHTNKSLSYLDLSDNGIGSDGACAIAAMLKFNTTLVSLLLAWNGIEEDGGDALVDALESNTTLTACTVSPGNPFMGNQAIRHINETMRSRREPASSSAAARCDTSAPSAAPSAGPGAVATQAPAAAASTLSAEPPDTAAAPDPVPDTQPVVEEYMGGSAVEQPVPKSTATRVSPRDFQSLVKKAWFLAIVLAMVTRIIYLRFFD